MLNTKFDYGIGQIHEDMKNQQKFEKLEVDEDKPGSGQFYCISCARFFQSQAPWMFLKQRKSIKECSKECHKTYNHQQAYEAGK